MRFRLRWKILLFTVLPPVVLTAAALSIVNRSVSRQAQATIREGLERSAMVFEHMLAARSEKLAVSAQVIVRDPRFFSILTIRVSSGDPHYRATVEAVAKDFNAITRSDIFEVLGRSGERLASVGHVSSTPESRDSLVRSALRGRPVSGVLIEPGSHYQVTVTPAYADGKVVGVLMLGAEIGKALALELRTLTRSEVTFVSGGVETGSSFARREDAEALLAALRASGRAGAVTHPTPDSRQLFEVRAPHETYLTLVRPIAQSAPGSLQLYAMQRSLDAETAFLLDVHRRLVQLGTLAALAALLAGFVISEQITRPVQRLVRGATEMKRGNYDYPLEVRSRDEIGYLADRFKEMREHERDYVNNLQEIARLKGEFLDVASHELRTPISVIRGYHELLVEGRLGPVTAQQQQALEAIEGSLQGLTRIAEDTTWMAQLEGERPTLQMQAHEVAELVQGSVEAATRDARERAVRVSAEIEPGLARAVLDGPRMAQAIIALVRNGIRFTPDGGSVVVGARREGGRLAIEVRDSGIGISEEERRHLFDRPVAPRDSRHHHSSAGLGFRSSGLGLGLSLARAIVEAHGGSIGVTSEPGKGSSFVIRVPCEHEERVGATA